MSVTSITGSAFGGSAREAIIDEIRRAHQAAGQAVEAAGWLFGQYRPRAETNWTEVAVITRSTAGPGDRSSVYLSDPIEALAAVRAAGHPHLNILGDWHSHTVGGSELPSQADAKAWAGTMDSLGRDAYVSVVVSPSPEMGWMSPHFSAWIAGRHGSTLDAARRPSEAQLLRGGEQWHSSLNNRRYASTTCNRRRP